MLNIVKTAQRRASLPMVIMHALLIGTLCVAMLTTLPVY
jgi:hypothetical protein